MLKFLEFKYPILLLLFYLFILAKLLSLWSQTIPNRDVPLGWELCNAFQCTLLHRNFLEIDRLVSI